MGKKWNVEAVFDMRDMATEYAYDAKEIYGKGNIKIRDTGHSYQVLVRD
jgi:hypothetical protein